MSYVEIESLTKRYGHITAVDDLSLKVEKGEFVTLVGPSGCGKTTTLRMIAGFEEPDAGRILIDGEDITEQPPYERDVSMVFQSYALFPHMNVFDNIAYGMRMKRKFSKEVIRSRVQELLELVRLPDIADRSPKKLSGGQQQRVALARALAVQPAVLLLDEPLASLDKKLREEMQVELRRLHEKVGATTIFVTHNQREAMTMSDRIAVMNAGRIEQVGDPIEIYRDPANRFVADFIGASNLFVGKVKSVEAERAWIAINDRWIIACDRTEGLSEAQSVYVCIRPEDIILGGSSEITGVITFKRHLGSVVEYYIAVGQGMEICATAQGRKEEYKEGMRVSIAIDPRYVKVLKD